MTGATLATLGMATFLCSLVAGFLFAFAVVVMPGLATLDDGPYLRAFQVIDGVIQRSQPLFGLLWVGSIAAVIAALVIGVPGLTGVPRLLLVAAGALYLGGVQMPTAAVNIPLNNAVQALEVAELDADRATKARSAFEARWNRWNVFRTVVAAVTVVLLLLALGAAGSIESPRPTSADTELPSSSERK